MEVYIEYVLIDNIIINFLLLHIVSKICNLHAYKRNIIFSALIASMFSILTPLVTLNNILITLFKLMVGAIILLFLKRFKSIKKYLCVYFVFLTITFLFGGLIIATLSIFNINYTVNGLLFLNFEIPLSLFIVPIYFYYLLFMKIYRYLQSKMRVSTYFFQTKLFVNNKYHSLTGYIDTGNNLYDNDKKPIVVLSFNHFVNIFSNIPVYKILLKNITEKDIKNSHYIDVCTVNAKEKMLVFKADELLLNDTKGDRRIFKDISVGVSNKSFEEYDLILHNNLI